MKKTLLAIILVFNFSSHAQFGLFASAAYMKVNSVQAFYNNTAPGLGQNIGNAVFQGTNFGVFERNTGRLKLIGAEIKTFKGVTDNVCSGTINYVVYPVGARPAVPIFNSIALGFYSDCIAPACTTFFGSFTVASGGGCCSERDQKWQSPGSGTPVEVDLTNITEGNYTLEIFYSFTGEDGGNDCPTTKFDNNGNSPDNYTANFTITAPLPVSFGTIQVRNFGSYNTIKWNTLSESDTEKFELQRSGNGTVFQTIKELPAAGFSSVIRNYALIDPNPATGNNFYRIKMVETGGQTALSEIVITVNKGNKNAYVLSNPVTDQIRLRGISVGQQILLYSAHGAEVINTKAISTYFDVDVRHLSGGQYFLKIVNGVTADVFSISILK